MKKSVNDVRRPKFAQIKIQTVRTVTVQAVDPETGMGPTIGGIVDEMITEMTRDGQIPNKLVIDLNPPEPENPADMGE